MRVVVVLTLLLTACRGGFEPVRFDSAPTADSGVLVDASMDAALGVYCNPLVNVTSAQCQAAFANPTGATDAVIHECALGCQFGRCSILEKSDCPCSCPEYVKSEVLCDPTSGTCTAPLTGTGCLGSNFYSGPPLNCVSASGLATEAACILRYLVANNDC